MKKINQKTILSFALGFVVIWFGVNEILHPASWTAFVPSFIENLIAGVSISSLVVLHGLVLCILGVLIVLNRLRRPAAILLCLMLLEIILHFIFTTGLEEIAVRDIGLLGMAIALALKD